MIPAWLHYGGYVLLFVAILLISRELRSLVRAENTFQRLYPAYWLVALTYAVGVGLKITGIGPDFVRFHLSDVGFPLLLGGALADRAIRLYKRNRPSGLPERVTPMLLRLRMLSVVFALVLSVGYEVLGPQVLYASHPGAKAMLVGRFDWLDITAYCLGVVLGVAILQWQYVLVQRHIAHLGVLRQQLSEAERQAVLARRRERKAAGGRRRKKRPRRR